MGILPAGEISSWALNREFRQAEQDKGYDF
jgi:hypothetical protein